MIRKVIKRKNETRKDYLLRVVTVFIDEIENSNDEGMSAVVNYDDADCDLSCLRDDILIEIE